MARGISRPKLDYSKGAPGLMAPARTGKEDPDDAYLRPPGDGTALARHPATAAPRIGRQRAADVRRRRFAGDAGCRAGRADRRPDGDHRRAGLGETVEVRHLDRGLL